MYSLQFEKQIYIFLKPNKIKIKVNFVIAQIYKQLFINNSSNIFIQSKVKTISLFLILKI